MRFRVASEIIYDVHSPSTIILNIHALRTPTQTVLEETFQIEPYVKTKELNSANGENRLVQFETLENKHLHLSYQAVVDASHTLMDSHQLSDSPVMQLDASVVPYLFASRYCQSDKLGKLAYDKFGSFEGAYAKVVAITEWIYKNVDYLSGSTNSQTSAYDTVTQRTGVCRDFAHLGIALCRALSIPARYFTGYAHQLNPPDFHACFEAFIGGQWLIFDPTRLAPLNGLVKIATSFDAAHASIATIFGSITCTGMTVTCEALDPDFLPFNHQDLPTRALTLSGYLKISGE